MSQSKVRPIITRNPWIAALDIVPRLGPKGTAWLTAFIVLGFALVFFCLDVWTGEAIFVANEGVIDERAVGSDIWHLNLPLKAEYQRQLRSGSLPFWSANLGLGVPMLAEGEVGAIYPLNLLLFSVFDLVRAYNLAILLHFPVLAAGVALLSRSRGTDPLAACIAGVVVAFSGFTLCHIRHSAIIAGVAWTPYLLYLADRQLQQPTRWQTFGVSLVLAQVGLAGHPQMLYYTLLALAAFVLAESWPGLFAERSTRRTTWARVLGLGLSSVCGLGLSAPQLLPTWQLALLSERIEGITVESARLQAYGFQHLRTWIDPRAFGDPARGDFDYHAASMPYWEYTAYVGIVPVVLLVPGLAIAVRKRQRGLVAVFVMALVMLLAHEFGGDHVLFGLLPGHELFRMHSRVLFWLTVAVAIFTATALTWLAARCQLSPRMCTVVYIVVGSLCFWDGFRVLSHHNRSAPTEDWLMPSPAVTAILADTPADARPPSRLAVQDPKFEVFVSAYHQAEGWAGDLEPYKSVQCMMYPNQQALFGLPAVSVRVPLRPRWLDRRVPEALFDVRYFVVPVWASGQAMVPFPIDTMQELSRCGVSSKWQTGESFSVRLYRWSGALPRAYVSGGAVVSDDLADLVENPQYDPHKVVALADPPAGEHSRALGSPHRVAASVDFEAYRDDYVRLNVESDEPGWLFLGDAYYPAWHAYVDGVEHQVHRANQAGRAIRIPRGRHQVEFRFEPRAFRWGLLVAILSMLGCTLLSNLPWARGRQSDAAKSASRRSTKVQPEQMYAGLADSN